MGLVSVYTAIEKLQCMQCVYIIEYTGTQVQP